MNWSTRIRSITDALGQHRGGMPYGGIVSLAKHLGVSVSCVNGWLSGRRSPNRWIVGRIQAMETKLQTGGDHENL
jgi:hypothetical protein